MELEYGLAEPAGRVAEQTIVKVKCNDNYVLIGEQYVECKPGGFYNDTVGECKHLCPNPVITNGGYVINHPTTNIEDAMRSTVFSGSVLQIHCDRGYKLRGERQLR